MGKIVPFLCCFCLLFAAGCGSGDEETPQTGVLIARIDGADFYCDDFERWIKLETFGPSYVDLPVPTEKEIIEKIVVNELRRREAEKRGLSVSEAEIAADAAAMKAIYQSEANRAYLPALLRYLGDTEEEFWQKREEYYRECASMGLKLKRQMEAQYEAGGVYVPLGITKFDAFWDWHGRELLKIYRVEIIVPAEENSDG